MKNIHSDSILIVGTGALASLFAARLLSAGIGVKMLGTWEAGLNALRTKGISIIDEEGCERTYQVGATEHPTDCNEAQLALVLVKAWQTVRAAKQLASCLAQDGLVLTLQNGFGNLEILQAALGLTRQSSGATWLS